VSICKKLPFPQISGGLYTSVLRYTFAGIAKLSLSLNFAAPIKNLLNFSAVFTFLRSRASQNIISHSSTTAQLTVQATGNSRAVRHSTLI